MATVTHGRRKGLTRSQAAGERSDARGYHQEKTLVIPSREWKRIEERLSGHNAEANLTKTKRDERESLKETSKAIVKNWENTIQGQRLKKLQARKIREEKEEEERVKVDIEEAKFQAEQRKKAIERAKTLLYYQTDRVKKFHGALLLSEVLREREAQISLKKEKDKRLKYIDNHYIQTMEEERCKGIHEDMRKAQERSEETAKLSRFHIAQVQDKMKSLSLQRQAALDEQKKIEEEVSQFKNQQKELDEKKKAEMEAYRESLCKSLEEKMAYQAAKSRMEELEDQEIQLFSDAKRKMTKLRKEREQEIFMEFQAHQNRMTKALEEHLQTQKSNEDEQIAKAVALAEEKRMAGEREKMSKNMEMLQDIRMHRAQMIYENEMKRREESERERLLLQQRILQDQKFHAQQMEKDSKIHREAEELQHFHKQQMAERARLDEAVKLEDKDYSNENIEFQKKEEEQFQQYTKKVIDEAKKCKANTKPLKKAAVQGAGGGHGPIFEGKGGVRPSYMAADEWAVQLPTYQSKCKGKLLNTQNRIGFTW